MARLRRIKFKTGRIIKRNGIATSQAFNQAVREMTKAIRGPISKQYPPASKPGSPPNKRTGNLHDSTIVLRIGRAIFVRTTDYGIFLDGGTSKMAARPFIRTRIHDQRKRWTKRINDLIRKNTK